MEPSDEPPSQPASSAIAYASPQLQSSLPGFLIAIGIISICMGLLGVLANGVSLVRFPTFYAMATGRTPAGPPAPRPSVLPPYTGDLCASAGLARPQRDAIIGSISEASFSADRKVMLTRLLGEFGQIIFPGPGPTSIAPADISHLPAGPDGINLMGSTVIKTNTGMIWIDDAAAHYHRFSDQAEFSVQHDRATDNTAHVTRSSVWVAEQLDQLHTQLGTGFNTTQAAVLAGDWLNRAPNFTPGKPFTDAMSDPSGATVFDPLVNPHLIGSTLEYGRSPTMYLLANGAKVVNTGNIDPATGLPRPPAGVNPSFPYTPAMVIAMAVDAAASMGVGSLLALSGLLMLCRYSRAASWHVRVAWIKLVETIYWLGVSIITTVHLLPRMQNAAPGTQEGFVIGLLGVISLQFIYPIVLLIVLRSSGSRSYFASRGAGVDVFPDSLRQRLGPPVESVLGNVWVLSLGMMLALVGLILAGLHGWFAITANPSDQALPMDNAAWHGFTASAIFVISLATIAALIVARVSASRRRGA